MRFARIPLVAMRLRELVVAAGFLGASLSLWIFQVRVGQGGRSKVLAGVESFDLNKDKIKGTRTTRKIKRL